MSLKVLQLCLSGFVRQSGLVLAALVVISTLPLAAQERTTAFLGGTVYPIAGAPIENGAVLIENGKIRHVGSAATIRLSADVERIDVTGKVLLPGLVDTHTHIGSPAGADGSAPWQPEVRALDAVDVRSPTFVKALAGGITTVNVMPGSGHLLSGQTVYLKIRRPGQRIEDWLFCGDPLAEVCGGMKMANGTNSMRGKKFPGTRARSAAIARQKFLAAQGYLAKRAAAAESDEPPKRDLAMEALAEVLEGRRIVHFHTHRHNDVLTALRMAREFGFRPVLHHVSDAVLVAPEIAAAGVPVSLTGVDSPGGKEEALNASWAAGAALEAAGAEVAFNTDDDITDSRHFLRNAALAVRFGMSREGALEALTLAGARMLGLEERVGSLEPGKDADLVILSGDPLSTYTRVEETWVEGRKVFDLDDEEDRRVAVGGYGIFPAGRGAHHELATGGAR